MMTENSSDKAMDLVLLKSLLSHMHFQLSLLAQMCINIVWYCNCLNFVCSADASNFPKVLLKSNIYIVEFAKPDSDKIQK